MFFTFAYFLSLHSMHSATFHIHSATFHIAKYMYLYCHCILAVCLVTTFLQDEFKQMSRVMRKPTFCICENKDADQLRGNREADQRLCFRFIDSTIPLLSKSEISSLWRSSVAVQPGLCLTRWETRMLVFS